MTWEPKNGLHDEDVDVSEEEEDGDNSFTKEDVKPNALGEAEFINVMVVASVGSHHLLEPMPVEILLPPLSTCFPL